LLRGFCLSCSIFISVLYGLFVTSGSFIHAQNLTGQTTQWFEPLDLGSDVKIKCFNGLFAEFVADCSSPNTCQSLRMSGNNTLECIPTIIHDEETSAHFITP
jgi:hypothetical protein